MGLEYEFREVPREQIETFLDLVRREARAQAGTGMGSASDPEESIHLRLALGWIGPHQIRAFLRPLEGEHFDVIAEAEMPGAEMAHGWMSADGDEGPLWPGYRRIFERCDREVDATKVRQLLDRLSRYKRREGELHVALWEPRGQRSLRPAPFYAPQVFSDLDSVQFYGSNLRLLRGALELPEGARVRAVHHVSDSAVPYVQLRPRRM